MNAVLSGRFKILNFGEPNYKHIFFYLKANKKKHAQNMLTDENSQLLHVVFCIFIMVPVERMWEAVSMSRIF